MDERTQAEILNDYEHRIETAATYEERVAITREAMAYVASVGVTIPVESLEMIAKFASGVVDSLLSAVLRTAEEMGADAVPVAFLEDLRQQAPEFVNSSLMKSASDIGVPLGFSGGVPDDLSELDGLT